MKPFFRFLSLFLVLSIVNCSGQLANIEAVSSHSLDDYVIADQQGEVLGVVDDVIVDSESGMITYAVVTLPTNPHGLSMAPVRSENQVAIPWQIVSIDSARKSLVFQLDTMVLDDAPRLEKDKAIYSTHWDEGILQYWQPFLGNE